MFDRIVLIFIIFAFFGWVWESIYCTICSHKWANRGFLYGPVCPIYGFGAVFGLIVYDFVKDGVLPQLAVWQIFIAGFVVSMVLEYPTSWALEKLFHARWWDYSYLPLNINGRTSVPTSVALGGAAILVMKVALPFADGLVACLPQTVAELLALLTVGLLAADTTLTVSALTDFQKKVVALDDGFQNMMTDTVEKMFETENHFHRKAVQRIKDFRMPERRKRIASFLKEKKFGELAETLKNSDLIQKIIHK